ncbi:MAG: glycoside hydrolase family 3 C-terminal domain-containing protein [Vicinamibacteria bacterium]
MGLSILFILVHHAAAQVPAPSSADIEHRVDALLAKMTIEEKVDLLGGINGFFIRAMPKLGLPALRMADGPIGVRNFGPATAMAGGIGLAATWNPALAERVGVEIGRDARAKGVHFLLGPGVNIYRAPMNGRNFEYFGEDPYLTSRITVGYIKGIQSQGVAATVKHFMGNNSEFGRNSTDSIIDERSMREIYLPAFEASVKEAHVGSVMDSYNLTNGAYLTQNGYLNIDVLKKEWGFDGIVMSDWGATHDSIGAANGGLDLEMPSPVFMNRANLLPAIEQGKVSVATVDDKVRRILRTAVRFGWLDRDQVDFSVSRYNQQGRETALQTARESVVLLKNEQNLLPLTKGAIKTIAVIGPSAYPAVAVGGGSARVQPFAAISLLEGIGAHLGSATKVYYARGLSTTAEMANATVFSTAATNGQTGLKVEVFGNGDLSGTPDTTRIDRVLNAGGGGPGGGGPGGPPSAGTLGTRGAAGPPPTSTRWTGYYTPQAQGPHTIFVESAGLEYGGYRLLIDDKSVIDNWVVWKEMLSHVTLTLSVGPHKVVLEQFRNPRGFGGFGGPRVRLGIVAKDSLIEPAAKALAAKADVVVVAAGYDAEIETEGGDRAFQLPPGQDELIQEMVAANKKTIVVLNSGGGVDMNAWIDRIPALVEGWYPGQEGGIAIAEILFGAVNPSGRLPVTFERRIDDNPVKDSYYPETGTRRIVYKEGVFVGYRGYEKNATKPLFPFGFGLSYTTFKYSGLTIVPVAASDRYQVTFSVTNTGKRSGTDVAQLYIGERHSKVPRPIKELAGSARVTLAAGATKKVTISIDSRALSYYDVGSKQWRADPGDFDVLVGRASDQIELRGVLKLIEARMSAR